MTVEKELESPSRSAQMHEQELSGGGSSQNNWKGMAISLLVILMVCSLIVTSIVLLTPAEDSNGQQMLVHLEELESPQMLMHDPQASWISGLQVGCSPPSQMIVSTLINRTLEVKGNCSPNDPIVTILYCLLPVTSLFYEPRPAVLQRRLKQRVMYMLFIIPPAKFVIPAILALQ
uniref:A-type potassium channel modulatory protein DPP6-like n=1 Tax=Myxine glutinosa TaxID=7769 RepID=UPI0035901430